MPWLPGQPPLHDPPDLAQLGHQLALVLEAASSIDQDHVEPSRFGRCHRVEGDGSWIGARTLGDDRQPQLLAPDPQLLDGCRPERIGCRERNAAALTLEASRELGDGGRLAAAVDAHEEKHRWRWSELERPGPCSRQAITNLVGQGLAGSVRARIAGACVALACRIHELKRRGGANVRGDERLLDLLPSGCARGCPGTEDAAEPLPQAGWPSAQAQAANPPCRPIRPRHGCRRTSFSGRRGGLGGTRPFAAAAEHQALASTGRSAKRRETTLETAASVMVTP